MYNNLIRNEAILEKALEKEKNVGCAKAILEIITFTNRQNVRIIIDAKTKPIEALASLIQAQALDSEATAAISCHEVNFITWTLD